MMGRSITDRNGSTSPSPTLGMLLAEGRLQAEPLLWTAAGRRTWDSSTRQPRSAIRPLQRDAGNVFNIFMDQRPSKAQLMTVFTHGLSQSAALRAAPSPSACGHLLPQRGFTQGKTKRD